MKKILSCILVFSLYSAISEAQEKEAQEVKLDDLVTELEYSSDDPDSMDMLLWLPLDFWEISIVQDPTMSNDDFMALEEMLGDYDLFAVVKGRIGYFGAVTYEPISETLKNFSVSYDGKPLTIIPSEALSADLKSFAAVMKPMMANLLGPMGENMHFVFAKGVNGPVDPIGEADLSFEMGSFKRTFDLPLSSLLKEKICPVDQELHSGKWDYCPFHGKKLKKQ